MRTALALVCLIAGIAAADTLDFGRQVIIITASPAQNSPGPNPLDLAVRAGRVLRSAGYDANRTVSDFLFSNPSTERSFNRLRWQSRASDTRYLSDGTVVTDCEFALAGPILSVLLPVTGNGRLLGRRLCPCCGQPWPDGQAVPEGVRPVAPEGTGLEFTGVVIDVRGLGYRPALFPRVVTEADQEVIGAGFADKEDLANWGMVAYYRDRLAAQSSDRVGSNPLWLRALSVAGINRCDVVISQSDALRVHGSAHNIALLGKCRVGLISD
jgi:hypothetical protein